MASPTPAPPGDLAPAPSDAIEKVPVSGDLRRLLASFLPANLGLYLVWGAIPTVLLPLQVTAIDRADKVANLAVVTTIGAFAGMIAQPIAGMVSDRTRSRFGRRARWLLLGAIVGGLALVGMALATGIVQIVIAWTIAQIAYNFVQGPLTAVLPDRVPVGARGLFSAFIGLAAMLGSLGGQVLGSAFADSVGAAYVLLAGFALVVITLFVVFGRDRPSLDLPHRPIRLKDILSAFWLNPVAHPNLFWAFTGRIMLYSGYYVVFGYNLYILQDYIGLGDGATDKVAIVAAMALVGMLPAIVVGGIVSDRLGRRKVLVFAATVIVSAGLMVPLVLPTLSGFLLGNLVAGIGFGAFQSVDQALISQVLPSEAAYAKDLGIVNIAAALPQTITPSIAAAVVLTFGYSGLFVTGIVLSAIGAFAVFFIRGVR